MHDFSVTKNIISSPEPGRMKNSTLKWGKRDFILLFTKKPETGLDFDYTTSED
jgi:hypothetical protein